MTGVRPVQTYERVLLTLLFTDIVGSTRLAAEKGDQQWRELLQKHHDAARNEFRRHGGTEVKSTGDGFLASFLGPTPAINCATAMRECLLSTYPFVPAFIPENAIPALAISVVLLFILLRDFSHTPHRGRLSFHERLGICWSVQNSSLMTEVRPR